MLKQVIDAYELLDDSRVDGSKVADFLRRRGLNDVEVKRAHGKKGYTDFVKVRVSGKERKGPTIGIIGRLGGIGARPERTGMVSDADGAVTALACALKLAEMKNKGDVLKGDVIITTHICPRAPIISHDPVSFMGSPVSMAEMNNHEVDPVMDAILSVDTTRGNRIINRRGFAITPTIKEGYILRISEDLMNIMEWITGKSPRVLPITTQDITPYENGLFHINSIMQPCTATNAPVVGIAITAETVVPGCGTGVSREIDIEETARYCIEVAKAFTEGKCTFYDEKEFTTLVDRYGDMNVLQTPGHK